MKLMDSKGITLKSRTLKHCIKEKGLTQAYVAKCLGMSKQNFLRKLHLRKKFNQEEVYALIRLFGAQVAIKVIWFPTLQDKKQIEKYVWGGTNEK